MQATNRFFLTEVKGQYVKISEKIGNLFLRPAQYLWHGKKIDLHQLGSTNYAMQHDLIYQPNQRYMLKTAFMVIGLIPATILGIIFKGYATITRLLKGAQFQRDPHLLQACIAGAPNLFLSNDKDFADRLNKFNAELDNFRKYQNLSKFISEITILRLKDEILPEDNDHWAFNRNDSVKKQIDLLWNLKILDVRDKYIYATPPGLDVAGVDFIKKSKP